MEDHEMPLRQTMHSPRLHSVDGPPTIDPDRVVLTPFTILARLFGPMEGLLEPWKPLECPECKCDLTCRTDQAQRYFACGREKTCRIAGQGAGVDRLPSSETGQMQLDWGRHDRMGNGEWHLGIRSIRSPRGHQDRANCLLIMSIGR